MGSDDQGVDSVSSQIDNQSAELVSISRDIHSHPELNFREHHSAEILVRYLASQGFAIETSAGGLDTAFTATSHGTTPGPTIGIVAEYDALPDIGHGCGHNLIAMSAVGAGAGLAGAMGTLPGKVVVIGTPAEEGGGGKIKMIDAGVFEDIDICLSSHPSPDGTSAATEWPLDAIASLAMVGFRFEYEGLASHAAASPHLGINALSGVIALFNGVDASRPHFTDDVRIHGIITDGGEAPNVIPAFAAANFMLRANNGAYLKSTVCERVKAIAESAAQMSGTSLTMAPLYPFYDNIRPNAPLARRSIEHARSIGMETDSQKAGKPITASTDFGNLSQVVPSYAFRFGVSPDSVPLHTAAMTAIGTSDYAHRSALATAKVIASTARDLLVDKRFVDEATKDFSLRGEALARAT
jgi:amidohydrolase